MIDQVVVFSTKPYYFSRKLTLAKECFF